MHLEYNDLSLSERPSTQLRPVAKPWKMCWTSPRHKPKLFWFPRALKFLPPDGMWMGRPWVRGSMVCLKSCCKRKVLRSPRTFDGGLGLRSKSEDLIIPKFVSVFHWSRWEWLFSWKFTTLGFASREEHVKRSHLSNSRYQLGHASLRSSRLTLLILGFIVLAT